jgi:peptide/nickel transport system substrate-binding protein
MLYDELLPYDALTKRPQAGLLHEWKPSGDGRLWLLELRPGVRWSDGANVTARDVVHTLNRLREGPRNRYSRWVEDITLVKRFNQRRVGVRLARPRKKPPKLPVPLLPRHIWKSVKAADVAAFENDPPIGSGPFSSSTLNDGDTLRLTARESHWRGEPAVDELTLEFFETQEALAAALRAGRIDVADDLGPEQAQELATSPDIEVRPTEATAFVSLGINSGATDGDGEISLREARVRRAIAMSLDRGQLRALALGTYGEVGSTIVPPSLTQHTQPPPELELPLDPQRADKLLRRAGIRDVDGDGVRENSIGLPLKLRLFTRRALPETGVVGREIAESLGAVGLEVVVSELTDRELTRRIRHGRYDLFVWGWDAGSDPSFIASVLTCGEATATGLSDTYFCDPTYDDLYESYVAAAGNAQRQERLAELQLYAYSRSPYVVLYYRPTFQAFRTDRFEASADESVPIVFAAPPQNPINLELRATAVSSAPADDAGSSVEGAAPPHDLVEEISDSLLWRLLALAGLIVLGLILLPSVVRTVLWLRRRIKRARAGHAGPDESATDETSGLENDGGRP